MPEVIAWPEGDPDYSPTARHDKPDECPNTNVPAHGRCPLLKLYPVLKVVHKPSAAGHPSADGRLSSSTRVIRPTANIGPTTHRSCVRRRYPNRAKTRLRLLPSLQGGDIRKMTTPAPRNDRSSTHPPLSSLPDAHHPNHPVPRPGFSTRRSPIIGQRHHHVHTALTAQPPSPGVSRDTVSASDLTD